MTTRPPLALSVRVPGPWLGIRAASRAIAPEIVLVALPAAPSAWLRLSIEHPTEGGAIDGAHITPLEDFGVELGVAVDHRALCVRAAAPSRARRHGAPDLIWSWESSALEWVRCSRVVWPHVKAIVLPRISERLMPQ